MIVKCAAYVATGGMKMTMMMIEERDERQKKQGED
jgi:hypothetical protein